MRIVFSAGEASGDAYAAALVRELRAQAHGKDLSFSGVGGPRLAAEIGELAADSSRWGAISIVQSLAVAPRAIIGFAKARRLLRENSPGLFIPIDFGFFNIRLCRYAKAKGWKVLYFVPPGSWRRDKQGSDLPEVTDAIVTPFPWSKEILQKMGASVQFFGHPIKQLIQDAASTSKGERTQLAVLPGSRTHEIERNLPLIAKVLEGELGSRTVEFAVAPSLAPELLQQEWQRLAPGRHDIFTRGDVYGVLSRARAAIVCSGTATLEAALVRCPMVVVYQITKGMAREAKLIGFKRPDFIALPNIVLQRAVVPELADVEIHPSAVRDALQPLLRESEAREQQLHAFVQIDEELGGTDAITRAADLALKMVEERT